MLSKQRDLALLFKKLATLRTNAPLFKKVETLRWRGATPAFAAWADRSAAAAGTVYKSGNVEVRKPQITRISRMGPKEDNPVQLPIFVV